MNDRESASDLGPIENRPLASGGSFGISRKLLGQIIRFGITGVLASLVHLAGLYILTEYVGLWYLLSTTLGFLMGFVVSFTLQKFWTFRDRATSAIRAQAGIYLLAQVASLGTNVLGVWLLVEIAGMHYMLAQFIMLAIVASGMFFIGKFIIFRERP
jgi:putative flippase GtrA